MTVLDVVAHVFVEGGVDVFVMVDKLCDMSLGDVDQMVNVVLCCMGKRAWLM